MTRVVIAAERGATYPVDASVFGEWAAHPCHCCDSTWAVTHVPSGRRAHSEVKLDEGTALAIAEALSLEIQPGTVPVLLPSDPRPEIPLDIVQRINAAFYGVLKSRRGHEIAVAPTVSSDHVVARGER